jgi:hypothetical protein
MRSKGLDNVYSCLVSINELTINAKIVHKGRGKFKILNDEYGGRYINKTVDASDVVRCIQSNYSF